MINLGSRATISARPRLLVTGVPRNDASTNARGPIRNGLAFSPGPAIS
jgi:hypothetical protein